MCNISCFYYLSLTVTEQILFVLSKYFAYVSCIVKKRVTYREPPRVLMSNILLAIVPTEFGTRLYRTPGKQTWTGDPVSIHDDAHSGIGTCHRHAVIGETSPAVGWLLGINPITK